MESVQLFTVNPNVFCLKCGHKGAIQSYGNWYEHGLGDKVDELGSLAKPMMEKYQHEGYMSHTMGFGGTLPWHCTNCENTGLLDAKGPLEGYSQAFISIKKPTK